MENTLVRETEEELITERSAQQPKPWRRLLSMCLGLVSTYVLVAIVSSFFTGVEDQSLVDETRIHGYSNWTGTLGAWLSHFLVFEWLGVCSLLLPLCTGVIAYNFYCPSKAYNIRPLLLPSLLALLWVSILLGLLALMNIGGPIMHTISGGMGYELAYLLNAPLGWILPFVLLIALLLGVFYYSGMPLGEVFRFPRDRRAYLDLDNLPDTRRSTPQEPRLDELDTEAQTKKEETEATLGKEEYAERIDALESSVEGSDLRERREEERPSMTGPPTLPEFEIEFPQSQTTDTTETSRHTESTSEDSSSSAIDFEMDESYEVRSSGASSQTPQVAASSEADLSYRPPSLNLLQEKTAQKLRINKEELAENKDTIIETLTNFRITISSIKATVGPTVTLYEIVPAAGVRISKIKNLEDDIALSLSALGIRIIAPMPGKGTIGIEVPNKTRELTLLRRAFSSPVFQESTHALPIVLGKDVTGEVQVVDLVKMPHILMAGATGQGKSVGLNVMLTSLLYKKRPDELKLVLVDPKKVELSLFSCIERHFLAKLPEGKGAIITDTKQVVHTFNSLCHEMDTRYELLKEASCRNIKEYNEKYKAGELPKTADHHFLPYIVLVIDELADLMMTAGKEVEAPIARLAQLARAIGIHLIVATQRPSVNVITGVIKANFPARISYRVTSQIDSRTILDTRGAEQLVGAGDMLFSTGSEHSRLQCPYVDTQEVESICAYISQQPEGKGAYLLPEVTEEEASERTLEVEDRDTLFEEAAALVVRHGQGSASLIQRKLGVGFNRAGRLIDQMEVAGIVSPPKGSKPREVLIQDEMTLQEILKN